MKRTILAVALLLAWLLGAWDCRAGEPIRIGLTLGLSGKYGEMSQMQERGYRLWASAVNRQGGLLGHPVELVIKDDGSNGAEAARLYEDMLNNGTVDLVFGPYSSGITGAILPVTERYGQPVLAGGASADSLWQKGFKRVFGVYSPASKYAIGFLEMLIYYHLDDLAVLAADDSFSTSISDGIRVWADRYGLNIRHFQRFAKDRYDPDALLTAARDSGARVVMICGHFREAVDMRRALGVIGWRPDAFYASVGPVLPQYREELGTDAEGTFSSSQWEAHPGLTYPGSQDFTARFRREYGLEPSYQAATAYAAGQVLEEAVARAGALDRDQITEALASLDLITIIGRYGADRTGRQVRHFPVIIQWQNQTKEIVWSLELQTAAPVLPEKPQ